MITPMSYAKAVKVAERGPKTEAQRIQALKALRRMSLGFTAIGDIETAKRIKAQAKKLTQPRAA